MRDKFLAMALAVLMLIVFSFGCRAAQVAPPGKWIHRTLANAAAEEAARRAKEIPPGRWWHLPYFATQLQITNQEKAQLDKLFDYNRNKLAQLKMQVEEERNELVSAINQQHLNEPAAISSLKKLEDSRTLMASTRFAYSLEVRKLLGYERFERLKNIFRNWRGLQEYISKGETKKPIATAPNAQGSYGAGQAGNLGLGKGRDRPRE